MAKWIFILYKKNYFKISHNDKHIILTKIININKYERIKYHPNHFLSILKTTNFKKSYKNLRICLIIVFDNITKKIRKHVWQPCTVFYFFCSKKHKTICFHITFLIVFYCFLRDVFKKISICTCIMIKKKL